MQRDKVIVTGFGPFGEHKINASWEAVKLLTSNDEIEIITEHVPVSYKDVEEKVKQLWQQHNPELIIHVGVSTFAHKVTLETEANRSGYVKIDCYGEQHPSGECCSIEDGCETITCELDVPKICSEINSLKNKSVTCLSHNAGRYLCEFIFYKSLNINNKRTMFIHVPPLNKPFTAEELAEIIFLTIQEALKQLKCKCS